MPESHERILRRIIRRFGSFPTRTYSNRISNVKYDYGITPSCFEMLYIRLPIARSNHEGYQLKYTYMFVLLMHIFTNFDKSKNFRGFNKGQKQN